MPCFQLHPKSLSGGDFVAAWFDDDQALWDDAILRRTERVLSEWKTPELSLWRPERGATPVLFNPNAIAVSQDLRDEFSKFRELEFLPVVIRDHGVFFVLHVISTLPLPPGIRAKFASSGNLVEIKSIPAVFDPPGGFFRFLHPAGSAGGRAGIATRAVYLTTSGAACVSGCAGEFLEARPIEDA